MYTEVDLKENKKMSEILRKNKIKVRRENLKKYEMRRRKLFIQSIVFILVFVCSMLAVGFVENINF